MARIENQFTRKQIAATYGITWETIRTQLLKEGERFSFVTSTRKTLLRGKAIEVIKYLETELGLEPIS
jgi:predicted transcriptional regulator